MTLYLKCPTTNFGHDDKDDSSSLSSTHLFVFNNQPTEEVEKYS
jgi:hypothetical protein